MLKQPDFGVPFTEKRDTFEIYKIPYYEDTEGMAPAGAIISNIEDMSHWLIALMNDGQVRRQAGAAGAACSRPRSSRRSRSPTRWPRSAGAGRS